MDWGESEVAGIERKRTRLIYSILKAKLESSVSTAGAQDSL